MNKAKPYSSQLLDEMFEEIPEKEFKKTERRMKLAIKIADAIKNNGHSKLQFAKIMNQHASVITKWLSGTHNFTIDTLMDLEAALNIKLLSTKPEIETSTVVYQTVFIAQPQPVIDSFSDLLIDSKTKSISFTNIN